MQSLAPSDGDLLWSDGSDDDTLLISGPGLYILTISNVCGADGDSVAISYLSPPAPFDLGPDRRVCSEDTVLLDTAQPDVAYLWQDGSTAPIACFSPWGPACTLGRWPTNAVRQEIA